MRKTNTVLKKGQATWKMCRNEKLSRWQCHSAGPSAVRSVGVGLRGDSEDHRANDLKPEALLAIIANSAVQSSTRTVFIMLLC